MEITFPKPKQTFVNSSLLFILLPVSFLVYQMHIFPLESISKVEMAQVMTAVVAAIADFWSACLTARGGRERMRQLWLTWKQWISLTTTTIVVRLQNNRLLTLCFKLFSFLPVTCTLCPGYTDVYGSMGSWSPTELFWRHELSLTLGIGVAMARAPTSSEKVKKKKTKKGVVKRKSWSRKPNLSLPQSLLSAPVHRARPHGGLAAEPGCGGGPAHPRGPGERQAGSGGGPTYGRTRVGAGSQPSAGCPCEKGGGGQR